ncbi:phospholipase D family protein [Aequorivita xiaoshiensis]|uniref:Phospholipase D family protein n=1 Tax=Aequorivita xiaoshiensis TaxID=2874476 RepID=A0A9X1U6Q3_9FLAO|nr:phospholipase D family protein [Aequorivita xiaoshiensis]MCG2431848.1 phospholipase D family protein [Aequorivita xiaoshiensis]
MSKFVTGKELESAIYDTIWDAKANLLIVSPFIKLDEYFQKLFNKHENDPKIHILLVFGKNQKDIKRSLNKRDFDFFKKFPNVSIIYTPNLHAKYYGNESQGIITSINLYDYSFINNIEFGVFSKQSILNRFSTSADNEAWNTCMDIAEANEVVFIKRPVYDQKLFGKRYVSSKILFDSTEKFYGNSLNGETGNNKLNDYPDELALGSNSEDRPEREAFNEEFLNKNNSEIQTYGYCIRTGKKIKFNPKQPMCKEAWKIWNEYGNENFKEKYCHKTGKPSYGKTSMKNPIL